MLQLLGWHISIGQRVETCQAKQFLRIEVERCLCNYAKAVCQVSADSFGSAHSPRYLPGELVWEKTNGTRVLSQNSYEDMGTDSINGAGEREGKERMAGDGSSLQNCSHSLISSGGQIAWAHNLRH